MDLLWKGNDKNWKEMCLKKDWKSKWEKYKGANYSIINLYLVISDLSRKNNVI